MCARRPMHCQHSEMCACSYHVAWVGVNVVLLPPPPPPPQAKALGSEAGKADKAHTVQVGKLTTALDKEKKAKVALEQELAAVVASSRGSHATATETGLLQSKVSRDPAAALAALLSCCSVCPLRL